MQSQRTQWTEKVACKGLDLSFFFETYETDNISAAQIDELCIDCPVQKECFEYGQSNRDQGLFGGFYLKGGEPDPEKNKHKTKATVTKMTRKIYGGGTESDS